MATKTIKILNNGTTDNWVNQNEMDYIPCIIPPDMEDKTRNICICGKKSFTYAIQHRDTGKVYRLGTKCIVKAFTCNIDLRKINEVTCGCGKVVNQENLKEHVKTNYHKRHLPRECSQCNKKVIPFDVSQDVDICYDCKTTIEEQEEARHKKVRQFKIKSDYQTDQKVIKARCKGCYRPMKSVSNYCMSCLHLKMDKCPLCNDIKDKRYDICGPCFGRTQRNKNKLKTEYCFIYDSDCDEDPLENGVRY